MTSIPLLVMPGRRSVLLPPRSPLPSCSPVLSPPYIRYKLNKMYRECYDDLQWIPPIISHSDQLALQLGHWICIQETTTTRDMLWIYYWTPNCCKAPLRNIVAQEPKNLIHRQPFAVGGDFNQVQCSCRDGERDGIILLCIVCMWTIRCNSSHDANRRLLIP